MIDIEWKQLIRAIKNEGTVLFIGPNIEKNEHGQPVFHQLCKDMVKKYAGELEYDEKDFVSPVERIKKSLYYRYLIFQWK